ncbi:oocyte zinc finger protein XlCOF6 [Neodiprion pinetum]|uniref:oocyte zinc finger protein XlCOF6 n=1 Tax=Neodiprion pinetum TaxID=441929 RepID=UPI001EDD208D|nr:zinc finger protein 510-like [Neodiprion pinetum]XP_046466908.1 zinc finger protein 510-like [Neodiprion pinetum]
MTMSATDSEKIKLGGSSAIHVGPIVTSGSNETISIVIPLSAQVSTLASQVTTEEARSSACNDCGKDYPATATAPGRSRPADNSKGCPFPTCSRYGRAFSRAHDLKRHIARHEAKKERLSDTVNVRVHRCSTCGEHFLSDAVLQKHSQIHDRTIQREEESQNFLCHICKKRYGHEKKLKVHLATHDKKSISTMCALCGLRFEDDGQLQTHMKEHTSCGLLGAQTSLGGIRSLPQIDNTEEEFFTNEEHLDKVQGKTFAASEQPAIADVDKNANNNAPDKIRCDYCWKTFKSKWTLNSHVAAHEGRFQFDCDQCGKRFVRKSHFEGHRRSHEAARPYACEICGSTFKQAKHRREHIKRKHPGTRNAVQNLLDSISACVSEESSIDQPKFTLLVPVEFNP